MPTFSLAPDFIKVTAEYSNAVLVAILPHISDFAQKLEIPVATPVTVQQVACFKCSADRTDPGGTIFLTNGYTFSFGSGIVDGFSNDRRSFLRIESNERLSEFYGPSKMSDDEAVAFARKTVRKLGYLEADLFMDGKPTSLQAPFKDDDKMVPYYRIKWNGQEHRSGFDIEIDANHKVITHMELSSCIIRERAVKVGVQPNVTPEEKQLLEQILPVVSDFARTLRLPIVLPVTTNHIDAFDIKNEHLVLTNGYEFQCHGYVRFFKAPGAFFFGSLNAHASSYWGESKLSEKEALQLSRQTLTQLGYWSLPYFYDSTPDEVQRPSKLGSHMVPHYMFSWSHHFPKKPGDRQPDINAYAEVEIDAASKTVKFFRGWTNSIPSKSEPQRSSTNVSAAKDGIPTRRRGIEYRMRSAGTNAPAVRTQNFDNTESSGSSLGLPLAD